MVLLLIETAAGFALFKVLKEKKLKEAKDLWKDFESLSKAQKVVELKAFDKFEGTLGALEAATAIVDSNLSKGLKKFLKKKVKDEELAVQDSKLGNIIKEKLGIPCIHNPAVNELARGVKAQLENLIPGLSSSKLALGLSHSISRYKLKFSPDKVNFKGEKGRTLLLDLDKEINVYAMRVREWYGWHFPEMGKIVQDNIQYAKAVHPHSRNLFVTRPQIQLVQFRENAQSVDLSSVLSEEVEESLKQAAVTSMGTEITQDDMDNITDLSKQLIDLSNYRSELFEYLSNRMRAVAPNLTVLVGELVGAKLISHAGSLMNLAKHSGASIQMLGAEKALFRALKSRTATPKYGLLFHSSFVGGCSAKNKGKIARLLAAKTALVSRVDALAEEENNSIGITCREQMENRIAGLEQRSTTAGAPSLKTRTEVKQESGIKPEPSVISAAPVLYHTAADVVMNPTESGTETEPASPKERPSKKQKRDKQKKSAVQDSGSEPKAQDPSPSTLETPTKESTKKRKDKDDKERKPKKQKRETTTSKKKKKKTEES